MSAPEGYLVKCKQCGHKYYIYPDNTRPLCPNCNTWNEKPVKLNIGGGPIEIDGYIKDEGWNGAEKISRFFEHNPGDSHG